jgi:hypothetical protein
MTITPAQRTARSAASARYRAKNPEKTKAMQSSWRARNPNYHKQHAIRYAPRKRELARLRKYPQPALWPQQRNCECCKAQFDDEVPARRACFDHDHVSGAFRGWICNSCNITLARIGDSKEGLQKFIAYFDRAQLLA